MPAPKKIRSIETPPLFKNFKPKGIPAVNLNKIEMTLDEYEALKLIDFLGKDQIEAAKEMNISRPTVTRLLNKARKKVAEMIVQGAELVIDGGEYCFKKNILFCQNCSSKIEIAIENKISDCPHCHSHKIKALSSEFK